MPKMSRSRVACSPCSENTSNLRCIADAVRESPHANLVVVHERCRYWLQAIYFLGLPARRLAVRRDGGPDPGIHFSDAARLVSRSAARQQYRDATVRARRHGLLDGFGTILRHIGSGHG